MLIYKQYDQAALDRQYNNRLQVPGFGKHLERWEWFSRATEKEYQPRKDIAYGRQSRQLLDIYPSPKPKSKTLIFIHGGYWQRMDKADFHFIARAFRPYHITTVFINYPLAPFASIDQIVSSCQEAVAWIHRNIPAFNGDPGELYIAGHSAGGHIAAMMLCTEWKQFDLPAGLFKGACTLSGLFDLVPIQLSEINEVLQMDKETSLRNSPARLKPLNKCSILVAVGADESDEFKDQSRELFTSWASETDIKLLQIAGLNHFSIAEAVTDRVSNLHRELLQLMGLVSEN